MKYILHFAYIYFTTSQMSQVLSPKYDMDVYMVTLYGGEASDFC